MIAHVALVALGLALGQPGGPPAEAGTSPEPAAEHGAAAPGSAGHGEVAQEESLSTAIMDHVANSEILEYPGRCHGEWRWDCELDLRAATGGGWAFRLGGITFDMTPSKHLVMMWLSFALLSALLIGAARRRSLVPHGLYNFFELLVHFVRDELAARNIGKRDADRFVPYLASAFFFILFMNLFGLVPWAATATGNIAVTAGLAIFTFVITQYAAIRAMGVGGWLGHLTGGLPRSLWPLWVVMVPVEFLGLFTKPFALTVRLFANMVAGHFVILALLGLIFALHSPAVAVASVPMALAIFLLEIFVAFVQAYIFTMLSALFIGQGLVHHEDHDEAHGPDHGAPAGERGGH